MEQRVEILVSVAKDIIKIIANNNLTYKEMSGVFRYVESEIQDQPIVVDSVNNPL